MLGEMAGRRDKAQVARSILCVEPSRGLHAPLKDALSGFAVTIVHNGFEALRAINTTAADLYVLTYWLPDWSGLSLCRQIRKVDLHVPVCFFADQSADHEKRALRAGADIYLHVDDGVDALAAKARTMLAHSDLRNAQACEAQQRGAAEEIRRFMMAAAGNEDALTAGAIESLKRRAHAHGLDGFIAAGGTLAGFARSWEAVFAAAAADEGLVLPRPPGESAAV